MIIYLLDVSVILGFMSIFANASQGKDVNDQFSTVADHAKGTPTKLVFINHFNHIPFSHYRTKHRGPVHEVPPNRRFLLPDIQVYSVQTIYILLSIVLLLHLLRRRPINHTCDDYYDIDQEDESTLAGMRSARRSERWRLFFYQRWTSHVSTSLKLASTFQKDFGLEAKQEKKGKGEKKEPVVERMELFRPSVEDDDEF